MGGGLGWRQVIASPELWLDREAETRTIEAARKVSADVLGELAGRSDMARKMHDFSTAFRNWMASWSRASIKAALEAREG